MWQRRWILVSLWWWGFAVQLAASLSVRKKATAAQVPVVKPVPGVAVRIIIEKGEDSEPTPADAVESFSLHMTNPGTRDESLKAFLKKYNVTEDVQLHKLVPIAESTAFANVATDAAPETPVEPVAFHGFTNSQWPASPFATQVPTNDSGAWATLPPAPAAAPAAAPAPSGAVDGAPLGMQPALSVPGTAEAASTTETTTFLLTYIESTTVQLSAHDMAYGVKLRDMNKLAGSTPAWDPESPEPVAFLVQKPLLVRSGVRCLSQEMKLQSQTKLSLCAERAAQYDAVYFAYGSGVEAGECLVEYTANEQCYEGFQAAAFSFYKLEPFMVKVIPSRFGVQCDSMTETLGTFETPEECGKWAVIAGYKFFGFGLRTVAGECVTGPAAGDSLQEAGSLTKHPACKAALRVGDFDLFNLQITAGAPPEQHQPFHLPPVEKLPYACVSTHC